MFFRFGGSGWEGRGAGLLLAPLLFGAVAFCSNNPYGEFAEGRVLYSAMSGDPRTLDPTRVSDSSSSAIATNIHDTPYEFHYLKRPLELIPSMATAMPEKDSTTIDGKRYPTFRFSIRRDLRYMDDACFPDGKGRPITIDDFIYAMKRTSDASLDPFGRPLLMGRVLGFAEYSKAMEEAHAQVAGLKAKGQTPEAGTGPVADQYARDIQGVRRVDDYTIEVVLTRDNPVIRYYFSSISSSPVPAECVAYYHGKDGQLTYDRNPVASGPYYIKEWRSNFRMVLAKNPNYRQDDFYPDTGAPGDEQAGFLELKGTPLPMIDEVRIQVIKSQPPSWTLFDQGYMDRAGIPRDEFSSVIVNKELSPKYQKRGIRLSRGIEPVTMWFYFNLKDPLFENNRDLRYALSLALDRKELIERFRNGRGVVAHGILPPGLEGYDPEYKNSYSDFDLERAREYMVRAGYPKGVDPKTGKALKISMTMVAHPSLTSQYRYYIESFRKLGIDFDIEALDWPTVLERKHNKNFQMIHGGWVADYPDPQNFLQLFYGPNIDGSYNENSYLNPEFDALYKRMENMPSGPERAAVIGRMQEILGRDAPAMFLFHNVQYVLSHKWMAPIKLHPIGNNQWKYRHLDPELRRALVPGWNRPSTAAYVFLGGLLLCILLLGWLAIREYGRLNN